MVSVVAAWPTVALGEVARPVERLEAPVAGRLYRQAGVRLWGQGVYEREPVDGGATQYRTLSRIEADDIIVNKIWARNGSVSVVTPELSGAYVSGEFPTFEVAHDRLLPQWFYWLTKTRPFWEQCDELSRGTSGKNRIRPEKFLQVNLPLPPLDEQRRIVARIEALAARIAEARGLRQAAIREAQELRTATYHSVYMDQLKRSNSKTLGELCTVCRGSSPRPKGDPRYFGGDIPWIMISDATRSPGKYILTTKETVTSEGAEKSRLLDAGTLVVTNSATIGIPKFLGIDGCIHDGFLGLLDIAPELDPNYLYGYFVAMRSHLEEVAPLGTQRNLNTEIARSLVVPVPSTSEQQRVIEYLDDVEEHTKALKQHQQQCTAELEALLPSVLDKAFRGEL